MVISRRAVLSIGACFIYIDRVTIQCTNKSDKGRRDTGIIFDKSNGKSSSKSYLFII